MRESDTSERPPGDVTTAALAWFLLLVAVLGPAAAAVFGWDALALGWFAAPAGGLLLVVVLRMWSYDLDDNKTNVFLETASWLFPAVNRFRNTVDDNMKRIRENAQLINDIRSVVRSYELGDIDEDTADEFASRRDVSGLKVREQTRSDVADFLAVEINKKQELGAGLALCIDVLYADYFNQSPPAYKLPDKPVPAGVMEPMPAGAAVCESAGPEEPPPAATPTLNTSLLARLVVRHPLVATVDAESDEDRVRALLEDLPRFHLTQLIEELRERKQGLVENMASILATYRLGELPPGTRIRIESAIKASTYDLPKECARQFVWRLNLTQPPWMLELLYRDRYRRSTERLWSEHRSEAAELAPVLLGSTLPFAQAHRLDVETLVEILEAMETFDTSLVNLVDRRLGGLSTLATHYAHHLQAQGIDCEVDLAEITAVVKARFPINTADLGRLRAPVVDLDVLRCLGRSWIAPYVNAAPNDDHPSTLPTQEPASTGVGPEDDAYAVAVVAAGNYLAHHAIREGLLPDLARAAGRSDDKDRAAEIMLAQLWYAQSQGREVAVTVHELASNFRDWLDAAREELGPTLRDVVGSITEELIQGHWPTRLPSDRTMAELLSHQARIAEALNQIQQTTPTRNELEATFKKLTRTVGEERLGTDHTIEVDAETILEAAYRKLHDDVADLRVRWSNMLSTAMAELVDQATTIDAADRTSDDALRARQELVAEARLAARLATAAAVDRISADLRDLTSTDAELVEQVGDLANTLIESDTTLSTAVKDLELLMARDICHSRHYILTFDSRTGPVGRLLDVLTTHPEFDYNFQHYTANARFGTMPDGMTFEEFHENLTADIARVFANRKELVHNYDWSWDHDLARTEVTVLLYATALRKNVFSGARWWRTSGSTASIPPTPSVRTSATRT